MKDFLGNELSVGDTVVAIEKQYRNFKKARIIKIMNVKLTVEYTQYNGYKESYTITPDCCIKI